MRLRQIHLDFHTSEHIENIGIDFDPEAFATLLEDSSVDSITCFSRCHHGYLYYPSRKWPERIHPHLKRRDLLGEQITSCHARNINVPVYLPIQWDAFTAQKHPEWLVLDEHGRPVGNGPYEPGFYKQLCLNTPYTEFVIDQALEVLEMYPTLDGLFLDIINVRECSCTYCREGMVSLGMDPTESGKRKRYMKMIIASFTKKVSKALRSAKEDVSIFYNHSHVRTSHRASIEDFTHLELESLPSGGWGYWDFPITVRYARTLGLPCVGMTGKFHTAWGDFHSVKTYEALAYECFRSLCFGAGCSIGDQLHPYGTLAKEAYSLIGRVYQEVKEKEPWCIDAVAIVEIAIISPDGFEGSARGGMVSEISGCARMLQELSYQFDVIDEHADFSPYKVIILPDSVSVSALLGEKLMQFSQSGKGVITTYRSGLDSDTNTYKHLNFGVTYGGDAPYSPDFILPEGAIGTSLEPVDTVMYEKALCVEPLEGTEILSWTHIPFFNREWNHYCSHRHTPSSFKRGYPAIVQKDSWIHFIHPMFSIYHTYDAHWCATLVYNAISLLYPKKMIVHNGPSSTLITILEQPQYKRYILHILTYIPEQRGELFQTVRDTITVHNLSIKLSLEQTIESAMLVPVCHNIPLIQRDEGITELTLESVSGHTMIELSYA